MSKHNRLAKYGLTELEYAELLDAQDGRCAICRGLPHGTRPNTRVLNIDHRHLPGEEGPVRGLLCVGCNRGLGFFRDNPEYLANAIGYLTGGPCSRQALQKRYAEDDFSCPTNDCLTERYEGTSYEKKEEFSSTPTTPH